MLSDLNGISLECRLHSNMISGERNNDDFNDEDLNRIDWTDDDD